MKIVLLSKMFANIRLTCSPQQKGSPVELALTWMFLEYCVGVRSDSILFTELDMQITIAQGKSFSSFVSFGKVALVTTSVILWTVSAIRHPNALPQRHTLPLPHLYRTYSRWFLKLWEEFVAFVRQLVPTAVYPCMLYLSNAPYKAI